MVNLQFVHWKMLSLRALVFPDPSNEESVVRSGVINIIVTPTFCDDEVENEIQFGSVSIVSCENVELSNSKWVQHFTCEYSVSAICDNERQRGNIVVWMILVQEGDQCCRNDIKCWI